MQLIEILNTNFFVGLITFIVGGTAFILYATQKADYKRDAASLILLEIKNAERLLNRAKELIKEKPPKLLSDVLLMQTESWSKYKYLFVNDFDRDEWDVITDFYNKCELYDKAVAYNNSFFQKNEGEIRVNLQRVLADYVKNNVNKPNSNINEFDEKLTENVKTFMNKFYSGYMKGQDTGAFYSPQKPIDDAMMYLDNLDTNISKTSIGIVLKKLSKKQNILQRDISKIF